MHDAYFFESVMASLLAGAEGGLAVLVAQIFRDGFNAVLDGILIIPVARVLGTPDLIRFSRGYIPLIGPIRLHLEFSVCFFFLMIRRPPSFKLFPFTTLFRFFFKSTRPTSIHPLTSYAVFRF